MTRLILSAALLTFVLIPQLKSQTIVAVPFDELEASQYNIGLNGGDGTREVGPHES
jgi:hypothetical protein